MDQLSPLIPMLAEL